jgi:hypothetical protein
MAALEGQRTPQNWLEWSLVKEVADKKAKQTRERCAQKAASTFA